MKKFSRHDVPAILWALIIIVESSFPAPHLPVLSIMNIDKVIHVGIFGLLALFVLYSLWFRKSGRLRMRDYVLVIVIVSLFGVSDELHQYFVPNRSCDVYDALADAIGAVGGAFTAFVYFRFSNRRRMNG